VPDLLERFSSFEGYSLYPDVLPFFRSLGDSTTDLHRHKQNTTIGVLTNSDDRVPRILSSLGLQVGSRRYGEPLHDQQKNPYRNHDIDFVALSYDVGFSKPDPRIFDATKKMAQKAVGQDLRCIHIGDDLEKDYYAAQAAGWQSVLLDRKDEHIDPALSRVVELSDLSQYLAV
jgi:FMN phosphatase YigB (HAD superfamily)